MDICLGGKWNIYFDSERELDFNTFSEGYSIEANVPGTVDKYLEDRTFSGPFFYNRTFGINKDESKRYVLDFSGVSYYCQINLNGIYVGEHEGIWDGFSFDITEFLHSGENSITVKVIKPDFDKSSKYYYRSVLFGFIPDVLLPFGGIWKDIKILEKNRAYFKEVYPKFNMKDKTLEVEYTVYNNMDYTIWVDVLDPRGRVNSFSQNENNGLFKIKLSNLILWSPDEPNLYTIEVKLLSNGVLQDSYKKRIGGRKIESKNGRILVNGKPIYLRGVLHWGYYPEAYSPNPTYEEVKRELMQIKSMGFNGIKHCLYFPPEYYYELCDEMGILLWQEMPLWLPYPNEYLLSRVYEQYPRMIRLFINHPSVVLISIGCELDSTISGEALEDLYEMIESKNSSAIICDNSGSGECYEGVKNGKSDIYDYHFYSELHNLEGLINEFTQSYRDKKPWLFGEFNDIDTWRSMEKIRKVSGEEVYWADRDEAKNLLRLTHKNQGSDQPVYLQEEIIKNYGIRDEVNGLEEISYKQAYDVRKYILELTRRYSAISGYNITTLRDVPITTSGIFDDFNNPKWKMEEFRRINNDIVLIYSKDLGRIWYRGGDRFQSNDLYNHFSKGVLSGKIILSNMTNFDSETILKVELIKEGITVYEKSVPVKVTPYDSLNISDISIELPETHETACCKLSAALISDSIILTKNDWNIWIYPEINNESTVYLLDNGSFLSGAEKYFNIAKINSVRDLKPEDGILVTSYYDEEVEGLMERGWKVLYIQQGYGFFPYKELPFWREGIRRIHKHPVVDNLKHNDYAGLQFFSLGCDTSFDRLELEEMIENYKPIISRYDGRRFHASEYMFEYSKGKGMAIVTSLRFQGGQGSQARSFEENILGIELVNNIINYFTKA